MSMNFVHWGRIPGEFRSRCRFPVLETFTKYCRRSTDRFERTGLLTSEKVRCGISFPGWDSLEGISYPNRQQIRNKGMRT